MVKLTKSDKKFWAGAISMMLAISFYVDLMDFKTKVMEGNVITLLVTFGIIYLIWRLIRKTN